MNLAENTALAASETVSGAPVAAPPINVLNTIDWGGVTVQTGKYDDAGRLVIEYLFGGSADHPELFDWSAEAMAAVRLALSQFEAIINVVFHETQDRTNPDFTLISYTAEQSGVLLGEFNPPGEENQGLGQFDFTNRGWNAEGLQIGGYGFNTLVHELGHGMGLAHPHDHGGGSDILPGVTHRFDPGQRFQPDGQLENQAVWTMMSYIDGWRQHPQGNIDVEGYGNIAGPMAWDIALLQQKYGANMQWHTGDDVYVLPAADGAGTYYSSIWDAGGSADWMVAGSALDVTIDLRPASLLYEDGSGGWVSYAAGVHGGFTIANGVTIENAEGGAGIDLLIGNAVGNILRGLGGNDILAGREGDDSLNGGAGDDRLIGGDGFDTADYSDAASGVTVRLAQTTRQNTVGAGRDLLEGIEAVQGSAYNDVLSGNGGDNLLSGGDGDDRLDGLGGNDLLVGGLGSDRLVGGDGDDVLSDTGDGADSLYGGAGNDTLTVFHALSLSKVVVDGGDGDDLITLDAPGGQTYGYGGAGDDHFVLMAAATVSGGTGSDLFTIDVDFAGVLTIADFTGGAGGDRLDLADFLTDALSGWNGSANPFSAGYLNLAASGTSTLLQIDIDGAVGGTSWSTLAIFKGLALNALTGFNLGFAPPSIILGTAGPDNLAGSAANDTIQGLAGNDSLKGQAGHDLIDGGEGDDLLYGLAGDDTLSGGAGADKLTAGDGADILDGGVGNDQLIGGLGQDTMSGGAGADLFVYTALTDSLVTDMDLIADFAAGSGDRISLVGIDANLNATGNQAFVFATAFTGVAGQLVRAFDADSGRTTVSGDVNGDGVADFAFQMTGNHTVSSVGWLL